MTLMMRSRVHHAVDELCVSIEGAGLAQHGVNERGFSVVNVRDDGDVTKLCLSQRFSYLISTGAPVDLKNYNPEHSTPLPALVTNL